MRVMIVEDCSLIFNEAAAKRYDLGEPPSISFLRSARKVDGGMMLLLTDQTPGQVHPTVLSVCSNVISFRLVEKDDVRALSNVAGLEFFESKELPELRERELIARLRRGDRSVKIQIDELQFPKALSKEEARRRSAEVLEKIPFVEKVEQKEPERSAEPDGLDPDSSEYRTFAFVLRKPYAIAEDGIKETGLSGDKYRRNIKKLSARGLVGSSLKVGAKFQLTAATERGIELAKKLGLPLWRDGGRGQGTGIVHKAIAHYTRSSLKTFCEDISFPRPVPTPSLAGRVVDDVAVHPTGKRLVLQYCNKNNVGYETQALMDLHGLTMLEPEHPDAVEAVVAVAVNRGRARSIMQEVKQRNGGHVPVGIVVSDFDSVVKNETDWPALLGLGSG